MFRKFPNAPATRISDKSENFIFSAFRRTEAAAKIARGVQPGEVIISEETFLKVKDKVDEAQEANEEARELAAAAGDAGHVATTRLNLAGIAGLSAGVDWIQERGLPEIYSHEMKLMAQLQEGVLAVGVDPGRDHFQTGHLARVVQDIVK